MLDWSIIVMTVPLLAQGTVMTLQISAIAAVLGILGGVLLGLVSLGGFAPARWFVRGYVDFIRGTPLLVQIFIVFFGLPALGLRMEEFWAGVLALSLNCAGYVAEVVRGAVGSVEKGQGEAAASIGMRRSQILAYILLPQSIRPMAPALTNELVSLVKNTSLLSVISVYELTRAGQAIVASHFAPVEVFLLLALYYYVIITALTYVARWFENRLPTW